MPVGDGGPQRGLSLPASTVLITRGVSNGGRTDLYSQVLAFWRGLAFEVVSDGIRAPEIHGWPVDVRFPATRTQDAATHVGSKGGWRAPAVGQ